MKKPKNLSTAEERLAKIKLDVKSQKQAQLERAVKSEVPLNPINKILEP